MRAYEPEDPFGAALVSCANQAAAFFRISRSSFSRSFSRRSRRNSSRSSLLSPWRCPSSRSCCATQFRIVCGDNSNCRDSSTAPLPWRTSSTIRWRNSSGYRLYFRIVASSHLQVSTKTGQLHLFLDETAAAEEASRAIPVRSSVRNLDVTRMAESSFRRCRPIPDGGSSRSRS